MTKYKYCQSCGMPLKKDSQGGGTEADGTLSRQYCSHCYHGGHFTQPDITMPEMKLLVVNEMRKMGMPGFAAKLFASGISRLERWKQKN